jgi:Outer membrane lipoprotein carrier protein LolA-like
MTSGNRLLRLLLPTIAALSSAAATLAATDVDALIAKLARPAPSQVAFKEVRFSSLLRAPLVVSGELAYAGPTSLDRRVLEPYREHTAIRGDSVRVEREGAAARTFALRRAPELRGLLSSFAALLAGDRHTIEREFETALSGGAERWTLTLTPRDARSRKKLQRIVIEGAGDAPRCFTLHNADGAASVMLLGAAAASEIPTDIALDGLQRICGGAGA